VRYSKRGVTISVRDGGEGFAVEQVPDPRSPERMFRRGGRGVWILKKLGKVRCQGGEVTITLTPDPSPIKLGRKERGELCTN
jgi:hypothetical protein